MFTGLVETIGVVTEMSRRAGSARVGIRSSLPLAEFRDGESVAVDGVCLTVVSRAGDRFHADVITETLSRSTLGRLRAGSRVNLERALKVGDRLGGHLVQGHVDATARVLGVRRGAGDHRVRVEWVPAIRKYVAMKGSVALDGVSLTVAGVDETGFEVALIPETLEKTTLGDLRERDSLNVEVDLLARYLERLIAEHGGEVSGRS